MSFAKDPLFHVCPDLIERAQKAGIINDRGYVKQQFCTCGKNEIQVYFYHDKTCPLWRANRDGHVFAKYVIEELLSA